MLTMSWFSIFYLMSIADKFSNVILGFGIVFAAVFGISQVIIWTGDISDNQVKLINRWRKMSLIMSMLFLLIYALVPTKKDMILIVVGGTIFEYVEKDSSLQQLPYELSSFMKEQIVSWKNELKADKIEDKFKGMTKEQVIEYMKQNDIQ